jgi:hypothetical protein
VKWLSAHCGDIAQWAAKSLPSNPLRLIFRQVVNALDNAIGFQQEQLANSMASDDGAIVARPHHRVSTEGKITKKDLQ